MTVSDDRTSLRVTLRSFVKDVVADPLTGKEAAFQTRVDTEVNAILAGLATDEEKLVGINNFAVIRDSFVILLNTYYSSTFGMIDGNKLAPYLAKSLESARASLVLSSEE